MQRGDVMQRRSAIHRIHRRAGFSLLFGLLVFGCRGGWAVDRGDIGADVVLEGRAIVRRPVAGECSAAGEVVAWSRLGEGAAREETSVVEAGDWCFEVVAWDLDCRLTARGSVAASLPRADGIVTPLAEAEIDGSPTLEAACTPPLPTWPQGSARVPSVSVASLRAHVPLRGAPHHPRADSIRFEARPCSVFDPGCARDAMMWAGVGHSAQIPVAEDRERYVLPLAEIPAPPGGWRGRVAWRVRAFIGRRELVSEPRSFTLEQGPRDLSGDASDELIIGDGQSLWLYESGTPDRFVVQETPCPGQDGLRVAALGDTNGDGRGELVVSGEPCGEQPYFVALDGAPRASDVLARRVAAAGDLDGDGFADALLDGSDGPRVRYGGQTPEVLPMTGGFELAAAEGDFNGDGNGDAVLVADDGGACVLFGGPREAEAARGCEPILGVDGAVLALALARDANGDDLSDLALLTSRGVYILAGCRGTTCELEARRIAVDRDVPDAAEGIATLVTGDVNQDGLGDLILADPTTNRLYFYLGAFADSPWEAVSLVYTQTTARFGPDLSQLFGTRLRVTHGQIGTRRFDLAVTGREGERAEDSLPLVYLFEWNDVQPLNTMQLTSPLGPDSNPRFGDEL